MKSKFKENPCLKDNRPVGIIKRFIRNQSGQIYCELKMNKSVDGQDYVVAKVDGFAKT